MKLKQLIWGPYSHSLTSNCCNDIEIKLVIECAAPSNAVEIERAVGRLKNGKSAGICNIYPEVMKAAGPPFQSELSDLSRLVFNSEEIPEDWRTGTILPLYKGKGSKME